MKPIVEYDPNGPSGNIYYILAKVRYVLRKQQKIDEYNKLWEKVQDSKSYQEALGLIKEVVKLVEK